MRFFYVIIIGFTLNTVLTFTIAAGKSGPGVAPTLPPTLPAPASNSATPPTSGAIRGVDKTQATPPPGANSKVVDPSLDNARSAINQGNSYTDLDMSQRLRQDLLNDQSISRQGQNITIQTQDGKMTLDGKVSTEAERQAILNRARAMSGNNNVTDHMQVAPVSE